MSAAIAQLVAKGAQDVFLTGSPDISYFQIKYKKYTNFSFVTEEQTIQGNPASNGTSTVRFPNSGDLLHYVYFTLENSTGSSLQIPDWTSVIDKVELLIGGQVIDNQDSVFSERIAIDTFATNVSKSSIGSHPGPSSNSLFYPLRFFFCENISSCIPLIALQYHNVELRITWNTIDANRTPKCWANYVLLDNAEREYFTNTPMNMLIYQVQKQLGSGTLVQDLQFNHPVKFLASYQTTPQSPLYNTFNRVRLQINGVDITNKRTSRPHLSEVTYYYNSDFVPSPDTFLFPFCLKTSMYQPTGTLNFSRIDSARIISENNSIVDPIYAVNYNILKIENGMGGLLFSD